MVKSVKEPWEQFEQALDKDEGINLNLSGSGQFYIERKLPFLLVYRYNHEGRDVAVENMIKNEASYLICPTEDFPKYRRSFKKVVKKLSDEFGAFLLMEIWPDVNSASFGSNIAGFELFGPADFLPESVTPLKENLEKMDLFGLAPLIRLNSTDQRCPDDRELLLEIDELKKLECLLLGLKIETFYRNAETLDFYPLLQRKLYSEFSVVFRKLVFDFVKVQTNHQIAGFQSLARRDVHSKTWEIDKELVGIDNQIQFLLLVSPVNADKAWKEFKKEHCRKVPVFHYRMLPKDPELLKRQLYNIRIEDIDDPTLGFLFRDKRAEVDKMLTMLNERETPDFLYGSLQLFGNVPHWLLNTADEILQDYPVSEEEEMTKETCYTATEFAGIAVQELAYLQTQWEGVSSKVKIKDTINNMMVNQGILSIPKNSKILKSRADALIQHEIGTHVLTYYNGKSQPLQLLSSGIPGYEQLQEGIAVLAEYLAGGLSVSRMQVLAARVIAVDSLINDQDFLKTFELLTGKYHFKPKNAFFITTRVYRGGGFTKDAVYLRGLMMLFQYLKKGNPLEPLLIGKIRQNYMPIIDELISRHVLQPIRLKPRYLTSEKSIERLSDLRKMEKITDLLNTQI
jgi:uncharacterized protein (TIGR02421 family)